MIDAITNAINFLWGYPLIILVVGAGLWLSYQTKFFQIRKFGQIFKKTIFSKKKNNSISTSLGCTIGSGNIAGVASAIAVGGPGAIFWMWITAIIGMGTKMAEVTLAHKYREKNENGEYIGGPMYFMKKQCGKSGKFLAAIYSVALLVMIICDACFVQSNTMATTLNETFNISLLVVGIAIIAITAVVINGGLTRIKKFFDKCTPIMCYTFILFALIIIVVNFKAIPTVFKLIFMYAFKPAPVIGGFVGSTVLNAISKGTSRGIFANEAGEGTTSTIHATSDCKNSFEQGIWGAFEVFVVSFVMCTLTAFVILGTGAYTTGNDGAVLVIDAFKNVFGSYGKYIVCIILTIVPFTTYLGTYVEYKTSLTYLLKGKYSKILQLGYYLPVVLAVLLPIEFIWTLADLAVGFVVIPNLIALVILSKKYHKIFKEYKG